MKIVFNTLFLFILTLCTVGFVNAAQVKQSTSGICHDESSAFYTRTKNFTPFETMETCIADGGRAPKTYKPRGDKATSKRESSRFMPAGTSAKYNRKSYKHWIDSDRDCQNLRHELLIEQSKKPVTFTNYKKCTVKTGQWYDLYTDKTYTLASDLDVDHIVPLAYAHYRGASGWSSQRKQDFANDRDNLLLVRDIDNQTKSAQGPATWMPKNQAYRCNYLAEFVMVMTKYNLTFKSGEQRVINKMKSACGQ